MTQPCETCSHVPAHFSQQLAPVDRSRTIMTEEGNILLCMAPSRDTHSRSRRRFLTRRESPTLCHMTIQSWSILPAAACPLPPLTSSAECIDVVRVTYRTISSQPATRLMNVLPSSSTVLYFSSSSDAALRSINSPWVVFCVLLRMTVVRDLITATCTRRHQQRQLCGVTHGVWALHAPISPPTPTTCVIITPVRMSRW